MTLIIGLVYDLRKDYLAEGYSEEDVVEFDSESTIDEIEKAIRSLGHRTVRVGNGRDLCARLVAGDRWDLVFNVAEGLKGRSREAQVPAILELYGVLYTMSDPLVCAVTLDKAVTKRILRSAGLPTPDFRVVENVANIAAVDLRYPLFAKPVAEGTGKGINARSVVGNPAELDATCRSILDKYHQPVLVEEYLPGREFTVGIVGTGPEARVIGTMEIAVPGSEFKGVYSLETKELCEKLVRYTPALRDALRNDVERLGLSSYRTLECRDAARVDIKLDSLGMPSFMEVNPLPGMHPTHSDLPMIATQEKMSYSQLINEIIESALRRK